MEESQLDDHFENVYHVVIEGNPKVGKSSLLDRYTRDEFSEEVKPTTKFTEVKHVFNIEGKTIGTSMWDLPGECTSLSENNFFYQDIVGVMIVYDVNNRQTFVDAKAKLREIRDILTQDMVIVLVANKMDKNEREVSHEEAEYFANSNAISFFEVSALDGKNVQETFTALFTEIFRLNKFYKILETLHEDPGGLL